MELEKYHRFIDEAGDTSFYGKGKIPIVGNDGVSNTFILGMVKFNEPLDGIRNRILDMQRNVEESAYYREVPSCQKRIENGGFYFHACKDAPEIRKEFFDFMKSIDFSFEAVVARKIVGIYERKHNGTEREFYADLLSHLLKNKFGKYRKLVLNIAERQSSTGYKNLELGLQKAIDRYEKRNPKQEEKAKVVFNVQPYTKEPLISVTDYCCWAVQRVFERGETRFYRYIIDKMSLVVDLYDQSGYQGNRNYYNAKNPLTEKNKISPQ